MKGFTLIETLVVIAVFTILMGAMSALIVSSYNSNRYLWDQMRAVSEARKGVRLMIREIREAQTGENGSYPIAKADDKEFIFYGDVDQDNDVEKVRYFLNSSGGGVSTEGCVSYSTGGDCTISFSNFASGQVTLAEAVVSVEGDLGWNKEYADIYVEGVEVDRTCRHGCSDCAGSWQGTTTIDVTEYAQDGSIEFLIDSTGWVNPFCDWEETNHSMKAQVELSWEEELGVDMGELNREVIEPVDFSYPESGTIKTVARYVRNSPPIFRYFDINGDEIVDTPARLKDTRLMRIFLDVDVYPDLEPGSFELVSKVFLRNITYEE